MRLQNLLFRNSLHHSQMANTAQDDTPAAPDPKEGDRNLKAVKADDAAIPVELWNGKVRRALALPEEEVSDDTSIQ